MPSRKNRPPRPPISADDQSPPEKPPPKFLRLRLAAAAGVLAVWSAALVLGQFAAVWGLGAWAGHGRPFLIGLGGYAAVAGLLLAGQTVRDRIRRRREDDPDRDVVVAAFHAVAAAFTLPVVMYLAARYVGVGVGVGVERADVAGAAVAGPAVADPPAGLGGWFGQYLVMHVDILTAGYYSTFDEDALFVPAAAGGKAVLLIVRALYTLGLVTLFGKLIAYRPPDPKKSYGVGCAATAVVLGGAGAVVYNAASVSVTAAVARLTGSAAATLAATALFQVVVLGAFVSLILPAVAQAREAARRHARAAREREQSERPETA